MAQNGPRIVSFAEVEAVIASLPPDVVIDAMAAGFASFSRGEVSVPSPQTLGQPPLANFVGHPSAQACIKSAYQHGGEVFVTKVASGGDGLNSGIVLVFSQRTYQPRAILLDDGLLTELRTAAAGALAARLFAPLNVKMIGVVGVGVQARWQLRLLETVTPCRRVRAWARSITKARAFAEEMRARGWAVEAVSDVEAACSSADLLLTVTSAREPLVRAEWLTGRPVLVTAIGADAPGKQELEPSLVAAADLLVADSRAQCLERGELQHAIAAGLVTSESVVEIGECVISRCERRGLVVFDSTGVAIQDVKIAELAMGTLSSSSRL
uniref:Ornithine cyclodeaminase family protein n=1 Tax=Noctiluca scintillans TaxID=2966 RepID=A0A7S1B0S2_NOCSC